ncbi:ISNCY family transposase [Lactobacillus sp. ESL0681]|uniref:ISNCY family transposase n=1 Tax=Lactobacillus sp. ESL0681 TaxID=2983211 RepID=UPI0023F9803B|nr:ISNCY family transposase [Lactobacillus sp. ESL0681]WEV40456.1 ISNCY family transposase [Lactobacillus sp. ESL0681]
MKRIGLNMNAERKYLVIKELLDHHGNKHRAALTLGITVRQVNRLLKKYQEQGKAAFVHGNKDRHPVNSLSTKINKQIVTLYQQKYQGCNFKHYTELLATREQIKVSYTLVYNLLTAADIYPPKTWRRTRKRLAKQRYRAKHPHAQSQQLDDAVKHLVALEDAHPRQARCKYFGEEIQMDASDIIWFGTKKASLHLAIDNATGNLVGAYFDWQETLNGYYHVFEQILRNYGIPYCFKTDNRTVFNYETAKTKLEHKDVLTQFGYACKTLGTNLVTTSVSQAKGMVERANQTVQSRLKMELRLAGINSLAGANQYLTETFVPAFNQLFGQDYHQFPTVFETAPTPEKINTTLAVF